MAVIIIGIDLSSVQLDACVLADDSPPQLRRESLGKPNDPLIERVRRVPKAIEALCRSAEVRRDATISTQPGAYYVDRHAIDWIVIEQPAGKYGLHALLPILGAITASVPAESQIAWRKASEWRSDLGAKNTKADGHEKVMLHAAGHGWDLDSLGMCDEHQLDALGIACAWSFIFGSQKTPA